MKLIENIPVESGALQAVLQQLDAARDASRPCALDGIPCGAQAFILAAWRAKHASLPLLVIAPSLKWQEEFATSLEAWDIPHLFYPETLALDASTDPDLQAEKMSILGALMEQPSPLLLTTETALNQPVLTPERIRSGKFILRRGEHVPMERFFQKLIAAGYAHETLVAARGQCARRGGIVDCFSWQHALPARIEWLGDDIESIREFDPAEQTSTRPLESVEIQLLSPFDDAQSSASLRDYFSKPPQTIYLGEHPDATPLEADVEEHFFLKNIRDDQILSENRQRLLETHLRDWMNQRWNIWISCNNEGERQRLAEWLQESLRVNPQDSGIHFFISPLLRGFFWTSGRFALLTDAEIFGRYQTLRMLRRQQRILEKRRPADMSELELGDYVVHLEHGIALYHGIQELETPEGKPSALLLEFRDSAKLYVPIEQAYLVSKYVGVGKRHPQLDALGGARWERAKEKAQRAVMDYAAQLLKIDAERKTFRRVPSETDHEWQQEFENAFLYQETADQFKAIAETKTDMEQDRPMDRLICGDVGFGKTEVAIRAAFKAVMNNRQVAFLVPTTVLAQQHWHTLRERMADYPIVVEMLSRFRSRSEQRDVIRRAAAGEVDILVGTHRLISGDVTFKNLGLVIVDEEQRFGVKQKEQLKSRFRMVDVLTLSATPIPRTLYLALMGARDMSAIETPPPNRLPIETTISAYDERLIRSAIERELAREGQVFFLHNRIRTIQHLADRVKLLTPRARLEIAHGRMDEDTLEEIMDRFVRGDIDVLLSTTIIENGLDIPNANTIIIDRADRFGLADLYQLRGRVGRSQNRAYALLLLPRDLIRGDAGKRVQAIRQYAQLGSGYKIAMRDLELRGAGNLLGTQQSGHITAIGFDLYCRLLKHAVARLKGEAPAEIREAYLSFDFVSLHATENIPHAHLPVSYMSETAWRIEAYRALAELQTIADWEQLQNRWRDRFGAFPETVELLLAIHRVRLAAIQGEFDLVEVQENKLMLKRRHDFIMIGNKFPRLTAQTPKSKLQEIEQWMLSFVNSSSAA